MALFEWQAILELVGGAKAFSVHLVALPCEGSHRE